MKDTKSTQIGMSTAELQQIAVYCEVGRREQLTQYRRGLGRDPLFWAYLAARRTFPLEGQP